MKNKEKKRWLPLLAYGPLQKKRVQGGNSSWDAQS